MDPDEAEIREEIGFHLEMETRRGAQEGLDPVASRHAAESRFGAVERIVSECLMARRGGRNVLQRINLAAVVLLGAAVVVLGWRLERESERRSEETLETRARIEQVRERTGQESLLEQLPMIPRVQAKGHLSRPGKVPLARGARSLTLCQLVSVCGGFTERAQPREIRIVRRPGNGEDPSILHVDFDAIIDGERDDVELRADDVVYVPGT